MSEEPFLTLDEVAEKWRCSKDYVYRAARNGTLTGYKLAGWKFRPDEVERFWMNNPNLPFAKECPTASGVTAADIGFPVRLVRRSGPNTPVVYFIRTAGADFVKIGYTADLRRRMSRLQTASPFELMLLLAYKADKSHERELHGWFSGDRVRVNGEWFRYSHAIRDFIVEVSRVPQ